LNFLIDVTKLFDLELKVWIALIENIDVIGCGRE